MKDFWKNEWSLFLEDMKVLGEFCLQPVEITYGKKDLMLKPTTEEIQEKGQEASTGFWANEMQQFKTDLSNAKEFLMQPIEFK
ncbi:MAG: hypothetical protein RSB67_03385 [Clostridia bacterium]